MPAKKRALLFFCLSFLFALFFPLYFPKLKLFFFVPFLVHNLYACSLFWALWIALGLGVAQDLLTTSHFGIYALSYVVSTLILFPLRRTFFEDKTSTLFIMTLLFSSTTTFWQAAFYKFLSLRFIFTDMIVMSLCDCLYAYIFFVLPLAIKRRVL